MTRSSLVDALPDSVLALTSADGAEGTGFFVARGLVLTCAHVVGSAYMPVSARWRGRDLTLTVAAEWFRPAGREGSGPDLALLRVPDDIDHPVVCLAATMEPGDELWTYGHPQGRYRAGDSVTFTAQGPSRRTHEGGGSLALHHATQGRATPGFSGAPVLNWRTGAVCGVLRFAHSLERGVPGARLVPVTELLATYSFLDPPEAVTDDRRDWLRLLNDDQLRAGGWRFAGPVMRAYLRAAREAARDHPYAIRVPGALTPKLADVYVSQQMSPHGAVGPHADLGDVLWLPAESLLETGTGVVLMGGPGAGKSSLGRRLTAQLADAWLAGREPDVVPVRVPAAALAAGGYLSDLLRTAVERDSAVRLRAPLPANFFTGPPLPGLSWLVLVDGVDEVLRPEDRDLVLSAIASLWGAEDLRFLVTTRPLPRRELRPLLEVEAPLFHIQPFDLDALVGFAGQWFHSLQRPDPDSLAVSFVQAVDRAHMLHLAGIPLLATMLVALFAENPATELPRGRIELYEEFTTRLLEKMHRRPALALEALRSRVDGYPEAPEAVSELVKGVRGLLEALASRRQAGKSRATAVELALEETAGLRPGHLPEDEWREVLAELLRRTGLMVGEGDDLAFLHQTVQEFLAACETARTTDPETDDGRILASRHADESWEVSHFPRENAFLEFVFGLWARQSKDISALVLSLFEIPEHRRSATSRKEQETHRPGEGTGFVARLLHYRGTLPARVIPEVVARLRAAAMDHGCAWAAGALTYEDRTAGVALLEEMVTAPHLAVYQRLAAAWELASWDLERAITLLKNAARNGMPLTGEHTQWCETRGNQTITEFSVPIDARIAVSARIEAAWTLGMLDHELGAEALAFLVSDERLLTGDRLRAAGNLANLAGMEALPEPPLFPGAEAAAAWHPEVILQAAKTDAADDPAVLLCAWARDASRFGFERVAAAQALALHDPEQAVEILEEFVDAYEGLAWDSDAAWAAEKLLVLDRDAAVSALSDRITHFGDKLSPDTVRVLVHADKDAAVAALRGRLGYGRPHDAADDALLLAQIDREAGEEELADLIRCDVALEEAAQHLASLNPQLAVASLKAAIEEGHLWDVQSAQEALREIESSNSQDLWMS